MTGRAALSCISYNTVALAVKFEKKSREALVAYLFQSVEAATDPLPGRRSAVSFPSSSLSFSLSPVPETKERKREIRIWIAVVPQRGGVRA